MWLDEALTVNIARLPLSQLHEALKQDGAPPLYYLLLHFWTGVFGTGNVAVRSLSGLFMAGAVVAMWFAARRFAGTTGAWIAAALTLASPYAIRYATEARMYSLVMLLVASGIVAMQRAMEKPTTGRLAVVAVIVALFVYTQYWSFYLLVGRRRRAGRRVAWRGQRRDAARRVLVAVAIGGLAFLPWVPTFLYQRAHTGTPWGSPVLPGIPIGYTLRDFAGGASGTAADRQEGWLLFFLLVPMLLLGVFGRGIDDRRIEIDLHVPRETRVIAFIGGAGLIVGAVAELSRGRRVPVALQRDRLPVLHPPRRARLYDAARSARARRCARAWRSCSDSSAAFATSSPNARRPPRWRRCCAARRSRATSSSTARTRSARRYTGLTPPGLDEVVYPSFAGPERVDWVDYKKRLAAADPEAFVREAARPGRLAHALVRRARRATPRTPERAKALSDTFAAARTRLQRTLSDNTIFEKPALQMFPAPTKS